MLFLHSICCICELAFVLSWLAYGLFSPTRLWSSRCKRPHLFSQCHLWYLAQYLTRGNRGSQRIFCLLNKYLLSTHELIPVTIVQSKKGKKKKEPNVWWLGNHWREEGCRGNMIWRGQWRKRRSESNSFSVSDKERLLASPTSNPVYHQVLVVTRGYKLTDVASTFYEAAKRYRGVVQNSGRFNEISYFI